MAILNGAEHYLVDQTCCGKFHNNTTKSLSWVHVEGLFLWRFLTGFTFNGSLNRRTHQNRSFYIQQT
jgi:hypothetical protein